MGKVMTIWPLNRLVALFSRSILISTPPLSGAMTKRRLQCTAMMKLRLHCISCMVVIFSKIRSPIRFQICSPTSMSASIILLLIKDTRNAVLRLTVSIVAMEVDRFLLEFSKSSLRQPPDLKRRSRQSARWTWLKALFCSCFSGIVRLVLTRLKPGRLHYDL